jgi:folylpolyglutamate synthase/dihydropteroate synthase
MIQPGLERIGLLLKDVEFSWRAIHVAGTNGKGSICHYASALLRRRTIRTGSFTTPHLVNRCVLLMFNRLPYLISVQMG